MRFLAIQIETTVLDEGGIDRSGYEYRCLGGLDFAESECLGLWRASRSVDGDKIERSL